MTNFDVAFRAVEVKKLKTVTNITVGKEKVTQELIDLRAKIQLAKDTLVKFKDKMSEAQAEVMTD